MMKLNTKSLRIFKALTAGITKLGDHKSLKAVDGIMPLSVEYVEYGPGQTPVISLAHHYIQDVDVMWDPMMSFWVQDQDAIFAISFEQSLPPVYYRSVKWEDGKTLVAAKPQRDQALFANEWLSNIEQQFDLIDEIRPGDRFA